MLHVSVTDHHQVYQMQKYVKMMSIKYVASKGPLFKMFSFTKFHIIIKKYVSEVTSKVM